MDNYKWLDEYENTTYLTESQKQTLLDQIALRLFIKSPSGSFGDEIAKIYWEAIVRGQTLVPGDFYDEFGINKFYKRRLGSGWKDGLSNDTSQLDACRGVTVSDVKGIVSSLTRNLSLDSIQSVEYGSEKSKLNINKVLNAEARPIGLGAIPFYCQIHLDDFSNNEILSHIEKHLDQWRNGIGIKNEPNTKYITAGYYKDAAKYKLFQYLDLEYWALIEKKWISQDTYSQLFGIDRDPDKNKSNGTEIFKDIYMNFYNSLISVDIRTTGKNKVTRKR